MIETSGDKWLTRKIFQSSYQLIVCVVPNGDVYLTTQKIGQSYLRSIGKTSHFEVEIRCPHLKSDQHIDYLTTDIYNFSPFDDMDTPHRELFHLMGIEKISELFTKKTPYVVIRHPWERFVSGITEIATVMIQGLLSRDDSRWALAHDIEDIDNNKTFQNWPVQNQTKILNRFLSNTDPQMLLNDIHLSPWLSFVDSIPEKDRRIILLNELSEKTKEFTDNMNIIYNSKNKIYKDRNFGDTEDIYNVILNEYRNVFTNEYRIWQKLLHGREENS